MRIKPIIYGFLVLSVFFGSILAFQAAGVWSVSGKITSGGDQVLPSADDVNTIKGWMTLEQISTVYNVPLADLLAHFELPADTAPISAIKDLETELFSVTNLRTWLLDLQSPAQTAPVVEGTIVPTEPVVESSPTQAVVAETPAPSATEHIAPDKTVTGKTTFQELLDWGVPRDAIKKIIGGDLPDPSTVIKDHISALGGDFASVKSTLQAEVEKTK
jgi:hypothetical protein